MSNLKVDITTQVTAVQFFIVFSEQLGGGLIYLLHLSPCRAHIPWLRRRHG
jgi:hypothetical protein